jgi:hypothetical protein
MEVLVKLTRRLAVKPPSLPIWCHFSVDKPLVDRELSLRSEVGVRRAYAMTLGVSWCFLRLFIGGVPAVISDPSFLFSFFLLLPFTPQKIDLRFVNIFYHDHTNDQY